MTDDFQNDPLVSDQEDDTNVADNLDLEESEFEDEENAYLVNDDELSEGFQFQN